MKQFVTPIAIALLFTSFATIANDASKPEDMSNSALIDCANVSNIRSAVPEHRAMFRNYLMANRGYTFGQLSSVENEFKAKNTNEETLDNHYQSKCKEVGEYLYRIGY